MSNLSRYQAAGTSRRQSGLSLVELMISILLGLILTLGVIAVYLESKRNYTAEEEIARIQENGRFALNLLQRELMMAGFFGGTLEADDITPVSVTTDCAAGNWALDPTVPLDFVGDYTGNSNPATTGGTTLTCLTNADIQQSSDMVIVKRTAGEPSLRLGETAPELSSSTDQQWYLHFINYADTKQWTKTTPAAIDGLSSPDDGIAYWEAYARVLYVREFSETSADGIPTLCELALVGDAMTSRCLVEGIEEMQVEFGIDSDSDGVPERYLASPTAAQLATAVVARIYLLVRSVQDVPGYEDKKSYVLGSRNVSAKNDGFMRRVFTTTVQIRNASLPVS